jgi:hypothetical protein
MSDGDGGDGSSSSSEMGSSVIGGADVLDNAAWEEVDLSFGSRSKDTVWRAPAGEFEWPIQAAAPMAAAVPPAERLTERIRIVRDRVLQLKELQAGGGGARAGAGSATETGDGDGDGDEMAPGDFRELVLLLGRDYHGVLDEVRVQLEKVENLADPVWGQKVRDSTQHLGTLFVLVLESLAEVVINFGLGGSVATRKEVVSCCSKFAIGCMHLANVAERGSAQGSSFARFSRSQKEGQEPFRSQFRLQMRELPLPEIL